MSKERRAKQVVVYVELEDNVGAVLLKRKVEIPVQPDVNFEKVVENIVKSL
jgi:hypothetical protein